MSNNPLVTVCCAAYNHEKYIRNALEGFVNQKTDFEYEVIIHDDASTDGTADIIREFERRYPDIIKPIYQTENQYSQGKRIIFDIILPKVSGKYIASCEGDDYWTDDRKLQKQFDYMEAHPDCSLVANKSLIYFEDQDRFADYSSYDFSKPENCDFDAKKFIENFGCIATASMFYKTEYYTNNYSFLNDIKNYDYVKKVMLATEGYVYVIPEIMSVYRKGTEGSWTKRVFEKKDALYNFLEEEIKNLEKINEYRDYKYDSEIKNHILYNRLIQQVLLRNKKIIKDKKYAMLIESLPRRKKIEIYMKLFVPNVYKFIFKYVLRIVRRVKNAKCLKPKV